MNNVLDQLPLEQVRFHPHSFQDQSGRVFQWNGGIYRALSSRGAGLIEDLLDRGVLKELSERGLLVETQRTGLALEGFELVVQHRRVPFVSYVTEWCPEMLRDAGRALLDLVIALSEHDLTLSDAHPWNTLFDGHRPINIDLTSIVPVTEAEAWPAEDEFRRYFVHPLRMMARGEERLAKWLIPDMEGIPRGTMERYVGGVSRWMPGVARRAWNKARRALARLRKARSWDRESRRRFLEGMRAELEQLRLPGDCAPVEIEQDRTVPADEGAVKALLGKLGPRTLLVIDGNPASHMDELCNGATVCFSRSSDNAARLYKQAKAHNWPPLPLVMDFVQPTPAVGLFSHGAIAATERFCCDAVLAPDLEKRLEDPQRRLSLDQLVEGLGLFARRWLITRHTPRASDAGRFADWARGDGAVLRDALHRHFSKVECGVPDESGSFIIACEK